MYLCEYLPRLHSVSVVLDFINDIKDVTNVKIQGDMLYISTKETFKINLPLSADFKLSNCKKLQNSLILSFRVSNDLQQTVNFMNVLESQPWSCKDLLKAPKSPENVSLFQFNCINCQRNIVDSTKFTKISDMPSDLWVEMMDFWHCHKPVSSKDFTTNKNYNGLLKPQSNGILMGNYYMTVNGDTSNIKIDKDVICTCGKHLGEVIDGLPKLFKWNLELKYGNTTETYPSYLYIYNLILDKVNSQAIRKLRVDDYVLWLFNIGIDVTILGRHLKNASKILYYRDSDKNRIYDDELIVEDKQLVSEFINELQYVNSLLPKDNRVMIVKEDNQVIEYTISYLGV